MRWYGQAKRRAYAYSKEVDAAGAGDTWNGQ